MITIVMDLIGLIGILQLLFEYIVYILNLFKMCGKRFCL